jgi:hypothetical protein
VTLPIVPVDDVCTEQDLLNQFGGDADGLAAIVPHRLDGDTSTIRQSVLDEVLRSLAKRRPPLYASTIEDLTGLKYAVAMGTIAALYQSAITGDRDVHHIQYKIWSERYTSEVGSVSLNVNGGGSAARSRSVTRR